MKAMILAAGYGKRLRPITQKFPKPLTPINGKPIIEYQLAALKASGFTEIVMNVCYLAEMIIEKLDDGSQYGLNIQYSVEKELLGTGGGILNALPLLGEQNFLLLNADVWIEYQFSQLINKNDCLGHLVLVNNPEYKKTGDFALSVDNLLSVDDQVNLLTYTGLAVINPELLIKYQPKTNNFSLLEALIPAIIAKQISGEFFTGNWYDIGSVERLDVLKNKFNSIQR